MLPLGAYLAFNIPGWLREPGWWRPLTHAVRLFVLDHQTGGLFFVIFFEELGVPIPACLEYSVSPIGYSYRAF